MYLPMIGDKRSECPTSLSRLIDSLCVLMLLCQNFTLPFGKVTLEPLSQSTDDKITAELEMQPSTSPIPPVHATRTRIQVVVWVSASQIVCGCIFFLVELVLALRNPNKQSGNPYTSSYSLYWGHRAQLVKFWPGLFYILTGSFGVVSARKNTPVLILSNLVLNTLSCTCVAITVMASSGRWIDGVRTGSYTLCSSSSRDDSQWYCWEYYMGMFSTLLVLCLIQTGLALTSAIYGGTAVCPGSDQSVLFRGQPLRSDPTYEVQYVRQSNGPETAVVQTGHLATDQFNESNLAAASSADYTHTPQPNAGNHDVAESKM